MIVIRLICAVLVAWAINFVLGRPEAAELLADVPELTVIGPIAGAITGLIFLPKKCGGGLLVMTINGACIGALTIAVAAFMYLAMQMWNAVTHGLVRDFENFLRILASESKPLIETLPNLRLIGMFIGVTAVAGFVTELVHWFMARIRCLRGIEETKVQTSTTVRKAGGPLS